MPGDSGETGAGAPLERGVVRVTLVVRGRVQGVWYRGAAREQALARGIRGWARNRADGSVEILAEGSPTAIDELEAWCEQGPPAARVTSVTRASAPAGAPLDTFHVRG